ncbi:hypothetical protein [Mesorhizobium sp. M0408]|uniref:hypothetical protein n=1 Tax=Mesorhizobium sp. M0408 TaxID=2956942 RepID=UPI00333C0107
MNSPPAKNGCLIRRAGETPAFGKVRERQWLSLHMVQYEASRDPRCRGLIVERHHEIIGLQKQNGAWQGDVMEQAEVRI